MFYESLGALLGQAGHAMAEPGFGAPEDGRSAREARQIALLLIRVRAVWDSLFPALVAENTVLRAGLSAANEALRAQGLAPVEVEASEDPFGLHRELELGIDRVIEELAGRSEEDWARRTLGGLREKLVESAEIQGRLVDRMLSIRLPARGGKP